MSEESIVLREEGFVAEKTEKVDAKGQPFLKIILKQDLIAQKGITINIRPNIEGVDLVKIGIGIGVEFKESTYIGQTGQVTSRWATKIEVVEPRTYIPTTQRQPQPHTEQINEPLAPIDLKEKYGKIRDELSQAIWEVNTLLKTYEEDLLLLQKKGIISQIDYNAMVATIFITAQRQK